MISTLDTIAQLLKAIRHDATLEEAKVWWDLCERIESDLVVFDKRTSRYERELVDRLKGGLSHAARMIREGQQTPVDFDQARIALVALQSSIERRTIGPDGWPLKG